MTQDVDAQRRCMCGHAFDSHEHLRRGTDCAFRRECGCLRFRPAEPRGAVEIVQRWWWTGRR
ncbi:hypothetical protein [Allobranchiibius sp. CTAmp26]|uniref:hypothetical protein n=1 Tax=Allobranchiibius sp. CTAmp26 TaxID=2815214 RepID=UPI001AA115F0|nr:hypothetical protein [Allobranchiibius sp. CTAmp26]MBO1756615.1 hypothetical protein [Allobranchiibius sp. CTAmp26]